MRAALLSGFAMLAVAAAASIAPAHAQTSGGISITHGSGNVDTARGAFSEADQSATTLGSTARGHGVAITSGGFNTNLAAGAFSSADQQVVTLGGSAGRRGVNVVSGGANRNAALGFGSSYTAGSTAASTRRWSRAQACAFALSVIPRNRRRNSITADNSPS
jgi:hypothetical protein